jgi:hypothetical protein
LPGKEYPERAVNLAAARFLVPTRCLGTEERKGCALWEVASS